MDREGFPFLVVRFAFFADNANNTNTHKDSRDNISRNGHQVLLLELAVITTTFTINGR